MPRKWEHPYYISALRTPGSGFRNSETSQQTTGFGIARVDAECKTLCIASLCFFWRKLQLARNTFAMPSCCAVGCTTRSGGSKKLFLIPTGTRDAKRRKEWLRRIARIGFKPTPNSRLCEASSMSIYAQPLGSQNAIRVEQRLF